MFRWESRLIVGAKWMPTRTVGQTTINCYMHHTSSSCIILHSIPSRSLNVFMFYLAFFPSNRWPFLLIAELPFYCRHRFRWNLSMLLLLIIWGVEVNPGPSPSTNLTFGMLNIRSVVNKAPLLHSLITDHDQSNLALTETWVKTDDLRRWKMAQHHLAFA